MTDDGPRFYGIYRAKVYDANDPTGQHRLMCVVPVVNGSEDPLDWALPCFDPLKTPVLSGTAVGDHGTHTHTVTSDGAKLALKMPVRGDAVWVMFEAGDARRPVWLGTWRF